MESISYLPCYSFVGAIGQLLSSFIWLGEFFGGSEGRVLFFLGILM